MKNRSMVFDVLLYNVLMLY